MDLTSIGIETPLAIVLLGGIITLWRHYVATLKDCAERQQKLLIIADKTSDNNKKLIDEAKKNKKFEEAGRFWLEQHKPTLKICGQCDSYKVCPHDRKPVLK